MAIKAKGRDGKPVKDSKPFKWYAYGNVHSVDVLHNTEIDKYESVFHTVAESKNRLLRKTRDPLGDGLKLKFTLHKNDAVWASLNGEKLLFRVQKIGFTDKKITLIKNHCAKKVTADDVFKFSLNDKNFREYKLEKTSVNVIGKLSSEANN